MALTLRELGITANKRRRLPEARQLLSDSLAITRTLQPHDPHAEAATLHQLAVVETQEARGCTEALQRAESLLEQALRLETGTLEQAALAMQLGRVAMRQGQPTHAAQLFSQALEAYRREYASKAQRHVNTAAAHVALGQAALSQRHFTSAIEHLEEALRIRRAAYGGCDHLEVCDVMFCDVL